MKAFVISLVMLVLMIILVIVNSVYVSTVCDKITSTVQNLTLSEESQNSIDEISEMWKSSRNMLEISIKLNKAERMNDLIEGLKASYKAKNEAEFSKYCSLISELAQEISQYEKISIKSIC